MKFQLTLVLLLLVLTKADSIRQLQAGQSVRILSRSEFPKACASHADCPTDTICDYSVMACAPRNCAFNNDCQSGACRGDFCVVAGLNDEDGGTKDGPCTGNIDCKEDYKCNYETLACQRQPRRCSVDGQCGQGNYCKAFGRVRLCLALPSWACFNDRDCDLPDSCNIKSHGRWSRCEFRCGSHNDCGVNQICNYDLRFSTCVPRTCNHDADCIGDDWKCDTNGYCAQDAQNQNP